MQKFLIQTYVCEHIHVCVRPERKTPSAISDNTHSTHTHIYLLRDWDNNEKNECFAVRRKKRK